MIEDYKIIRGAVSTELCEFLALEYEMMEEVCKVLYAGADLSDLEENTFARYAPLMFEALMVKLNPLVAKEWGHELVPVYSYARIYYKGSQLKKHFDRPSSEVSVSVAISKEPEYNWPIYIKNEDGVEHEINLDVGDIVIYSGRKHEHWRNPYEGNKVVQAFLQYVEADGPYSYLKWDTKPALGLPAEFVRQEIKDEVQNVKDMLGFKR
jgi:hypothetical protein